MLRTKKISLFCTALACCLSILFTLFASAPLARANGQTTVNFWIEQVFEQSGVGPSVNSSFQYRLNPRDPANPMPVNSLFTVDGTNQGNAETIVFTQPGVYEYEVVLENYPTGAGYTCDLRSYTITVYITHGATGLTSNVVVQNSKNEKVGSMLYTHRYSSSATEPDLMVDPPVKKTVSGTPNKKSTFTFALTAKDPSSPMPQGSKNGVKHMTIVGSGEEDFGTWSYSEPGVYYYTISEVNTEESGYTYDTGVYTITDTVKEEGDQLILYRVVANSAGKLVDSCSFINKYSSSPIGGGGNNGAIDTVGNGPKTGDGTSLFSGAIIIGLFSVLAIGSASYLLATKSRRNPHTAKGAGGLGEAQV